LFEIPAAKWVMFSGKGKKTTIMLLKFGFLLKKVIIAI